MNTLVAKLDHTNRELRELAGNAIRAMLRQLCLGLLEEAPNGGSHSDLFLQVIRLGCWHALMLRACALGMTGQGRAG